jgi:hypothetical protein
MFGRMVTCTGEVVVKKGARRIRAAVVVGLARAFAWAPPGSGMRADADGRRT